MIWGLLVFGAFVVVMTTVVLDSPVARAWADRRLRGEPDTRADVKDLAKKVGVLESELEVMNRQLAQLQEEQQFLQRLIEDPATRPAPKSLPKPGS
jgi:hypothetical protein